MKMKTEQTKELLQEVKTLLTEKEIEILINTFSNNRNENLEDIVSKNYELINNYLD